MQYFPESEGLPVVDWLPEQLLIFRLDGLFKQNGVIASLILSHQQDPKDFTVCAGHGVPAEPFNGSAKNDLTQLLQNILGSHPKPHVHSCAGTAFADRCERLSSRCKAVRKIIYYPAKVGSDEYTFIGVLDAEGKADFSHETEIALREVLLTVHVNLQFKQLSIRLKGTEIFMKEIGHDLASSVQTIVAKLRLISENRVQGIAAQHKAKEAEAEIKSAWRIADSLGIAGDSEYQIHAPSDFDLVKVVKTALDHHSSEAAEKHIQLSLRVPETLPVSGDEKALEIAIGHLLSNAVKYSFGGTEIRVSAAVDSKEVVIEVVNKGHSLPPEPERKRIWDFGVRGERAKELHVNGSGIGLYTVRKVVLAHGGRVVADEVGKSLTRFRVFLPCPAQLRLIP